MRLTKLLAPLAAASMAASLFLSVPAQAAPAPSIPAPAKPGDLLEQKSGKFYFDPLKATKPDARVQNITYVSTNAKGKKTAVTGTLITPKTAWKGKGSRPLVAYAVGTQGMDERCSPSKLGAAGEEYEGLLMAGLLARGYQLVVSDYEGLGYDGDHPYVNAKVLGRNVLDSARAARRVNTDATSAKSPIYIAGYSEGGNAAAGALEQAKAYAPELNIKAGYAGAVPADLAKVAPNLDGSMYAAFLVYAVLMLDNNYPNLNLKQYMNENGLKHFDKADKSCLFDGITGFALKQSSTYTKDGRSITAYLSQPDIKAALEDIRLGKGKPTVPVLVGHSILDDVVPYEQGKAMAKQWCKNGSKIRFSTTAVPTHVGGAVGMQAEMYAFFEARTAGLPFISNCGWF